jgi:heme o synthase
MRGRGPGALLELTKLRISAVSTLSGAMGYIAWRQALDPGLGAAAGGMLLLAMAASALNEWQERDLDALMERTRNRPLPRGALRPASALAFALALAGAGLALLRVAGGWTPALLGLLAMVWYNGLYTPLKRVWAFAVVPGSVIGALPPAIGWTAAGGPLRDPAILALCFVFFLWQVPHFWLLALLHRKGYAEGGFPTLGDRLEEGAILRLVFTWTCATVAACALLPAFGALRGWTGNGLLALAALWLVGIFARLLEPGGGPQRLRRRFMDINRFALALMAAVVLDALGLP